MMALTLLLAAASVGAVVGWFAGRTPQHGMSLGWHIPFALRSVEPDPRARELVPAPSRSTGDEEFDAHFRIQPTSASAPAYLDVRTRRALLSWIDRPPVVLQDSRIEVAGRRQTLVEFTRLAVAVAGPPKERLMRIIRDTSEPLPLRRWAYDALPLVVGEAKAQNFAHSFDDREPVLRFRTAVLLDDAACLRELATSEPTAVAGEALVELATQPGEENRAVVIRTLDSLAECAQLEALDWLRPAVRMFRGVERQHGDRAIARIVERARNLGGGLTLSALEGGGLAVTPDAGRLSPAGRSPEPRD
jgi:hypothetical protein